MPQLKFNVCPDREKVPTELLPRRSSLRLQNKDPEGADLPPEALINRASLYSVYQEPDRHVCHTFFAL